MVRKIFQLRNLFIFFSGISFLLVILVFSKWGPSLSSDTFFYFNLAKDIKNGLFPISSSNSPGYPAVLALISNVFSKGLEESAWLISISSYILAILLWYFILSRISDRNISKIRIGLYAILISNLWWSLKLLLFAHADGVFYIFCLLIVLNLVIWGRSGSFHIWLLLCFLASVSVWIKYNGLIFLPFLTICPLLYYGFNLKALIGIVPVITIIPSFLIFKNLNGQVIRHFDTNRDIQKFSNEINWDTFFVNFEDTGKAIFDFIFTSYLTPIFPVILICVFLISIFVLFFYFLFKQFGKNKVELLLASFVVVYIIGMGFIFQLTNHTEMNTRTLFPVFIFSIAFFAFKFLNLIKIKRNVLIFIFIFIFINFARSTHGLMDWFYRAPMDSFVFIDKFKSKESVVKCKELVDLFNIDRSKIYTNNVRNLTAAFDYERVSDFGKDFEFQRGKIRPVEIIEIQKREREMFNNLNNNRGIIILFDFKDLDKIHSYNTNEFYHLKIDSDLIIYKK